jgi:hypothetical protein
MANTSIGQQAASSERLVREWLAAGGQQGGSRVEMLTNHGRCCIVRWLGNQPLTDGICDDVLDVVEGTAGETVVELTQVEKGIRERYDSDKKMCM